MKTEWEPPALTGAGNHRQELSFFGFKDFIERTAGRVKVGERVGNTCSKRPDRNRACCLLMEDPGLHPWGAS